MISNALWLHKLRQNSLSPTTCAESALQPPHLHPPPSFTSFTGAACTSASTNRYVFFLFSFHSSTFTGIHIPSTSTPHLHPHCMYFFFFFSLIHITASTSHSHPHRICICTTSASAPHPHLHPLPRLHVSHLFYFVSFFLHSSMQPTMSACQRVRLSMYIFYFLFTLICVHM